MTRQPGLMFLVMLVCIQATVVFAFMSGCSMYVLFHFTTYKFEGLWLGLGAVGTGWPFFEVFRVTLSSL